MRLEASLRVIAFAPCRPPLHHGPCTSGGVEFRVEGEVRREVHVDLHDPARERCESAVVLHDRSSLVAADVDAIAYIEDDSGIVHESPMLPGYDTAYGSLQSIAVTGDTLYLLRGSDIDFGTEHVASLWRMERPLRSR